MTIFNTKFFCGEEKCSLVELGRTCQFLGEDLDLFVIRFHERVVDCCDVVDEKQLLTAYMV